MIAASHARFLALAVVALSMAPIPQEEEEEVDFESLPSAVRRAAQEHVRREDIRRVTKETENGGVVTYEIETLEKGRDKEVVLDSEGVLLEIARELDVSALPRPVLEGLRALASGGRVLEAESTDRGGTVTYEAVVLTPAGKLSKVRVDAEGRKLAPGS